jgi:hypothetical protein
VHVKEEMAVVRPSSGRVSADEITYAFRRFYDDGVFIGIERAVPILKFAPQTVEMNRAFHHGVVDEHDADSFAELELDRLGGGELLPVESPDEALHIAGKVQLDFTRWWSRVTAQSDATFISHWHPDHADKRVARMFLDAGKPVFAPPGLWVDDTDFSSRLTYPDRDGQQRKSRYELQASVATWISLPTLAIKGWTFSTTSTWSLRRTASS